MSAAVTLAPIALSEVKEDGDDDADRALLSIVCPCGSHHYLWQSKRWQLHLSGADVRVELPASDVPEACRVAFDRRSS